MYLSHAEPLTACLPSPSSWRSSRWPEIHTGVKLRELSVTGMLHSRCAASELEMGRVLSICMAHLAAAPCTVASRGALSTMRANRSAPCGQEISSFIAYEHTYRSIWSSWPSGDEYDRPCRTSANSSSASSLSSPPASTSLNRRCGSGAATRGLTSMFARQWASSVSLPRTSRGWSRGGSSFVRPPVVSSVALRRGSAPGGGCRTPSRTASEPKFMRHVRSGARRGSCSAAGPPGRRGSLRQYALQLCTMVLFVRCTASPCCASGVSGTS